jgi:hypothetical protein
MSADLAADHDPAWDREPAASTTRETPLDNGGHICYTLDIYR